MCVHRHQHTPHNFYTQTPWDFCKQNLFSVLYSIDFAHKNIHFMFHGLQEFENGITDLCLSFSPAVFCIQTLVRSILKRVLIAIPLTCVWAYCPRCSRIISCVPSFSCRLDFGASRSSQVCIGPVLFRNLYVGTGWELSLKPKFKGIFFFFFTFLFPARPFFPERSV